MCQEFFDIRMFGAVMGMREYNAGQVRGPVQFTFARSIDPIIPMDSSIARVALERGERAADLGDDDLEAPTHGTLGRKATVPYGLYLGYGFFNPHFAQRTDVHTEDLDLLWTALTNMWDLDRSAARGLMACRGLYVFSHENSLGNAPAHRLFGENTHRAKGGCRCAPQVCRLHGNGGRSRSAWRCFVDRPGGLTLPAFGPAGTCWRTAYMIAEPSTLEDPVLLSALEHYSYCPRQCALIHRGANLR